MLHLKRRSIGRDNVPGDLGHAPYPTGLTVPSVIGMTTMSRTDAAGAPRAAFLTAGLLLGPSLIALGSALDPSGTTPPVSDYLNRVAGARPLYLVAGMVMQFGMAALVLTALALHRLAPVLGGGRLLRAGAFLLGVWGVFGACGVTAGFTAGWVGVDLPDSASGSLVESVFLGVNRSPWATVGAILGGLGWALGTILTGLALARIRTRRWAGIAVAASVPVGVGIGVAGSSVHRLLAVQFVLLAIGLATTARRAVGDAPTAASPSSQRVVDVRD